MFGVCAQEFEGTAIEVQGPDDIPATEAEVSPPVDVWDRIRRGYAMPNLQGKRVDQMVRQYTRDPRYIQRVSKRAGKYLYHIVEEVESRGHADRACFAPFRRERVSA